MLVLQAAVDGVSKTMWFGKGHHQGGHAAAHLTEGCDSMRLKALQAGALVLLVSQLALQGLHLLLLGAGLPLGPQVRRQQRRCIKALLLCALQQLPH